MTRLVNLPPRPGLRPTARANAPWYHIRNAATDTAEVYLFDEIGYWGTSAQDFVGALKTVTAPQIALYINSPGGEVFDGIAIYNTLKAHPAEVTVHVVGLAASAASFIAMAGNRIVIARNATMMIHDASGLCWGNGQDMAEMAALLDKLSDNIADIYAQRAGGTVEQWRERMQAETWYTGAEAVAAGLADEMTDPDPAPDAPPQMSAAWDLSAFRRAAPTPAADAPPQPVDEVPSAELVDRVEPPVDQRPADPTPEPEPTPTPVAESSEPEPVAPPPAGDTWEDLAAGLLVPAPDPWAELTAQLTDPAPSSADNPFTRFAEALL